MQSMICTATFVLVVASAVCKAAESPYSGLNGTRKEAGTAASSMCCLFLM